MADAMLNEASLSYAESFVTEDGVVLDARDRARELGCVPIGPAGGATLRVLAAATGARSVVEVGTGAGVSGLYLLGGMAAEGVLTTIDVEGEHQRAAKEAFGEAGVAASRYRLINGSAAEVLPRLRDAAYDIVFVDADKGAYAVYYEQALRLLRPGGIVAFDNVLWGGRVSDPEERGDSTMAIRALNKKLHADERVSLTLVPIGVGLSLARKR
jgi:predicted O-methyltransferase YrrM